jgi:hypothetical protein
MPRLDNSSRLKSAMAQTKVFFRRLKWNGTLVFPVFVLLSATFWYLQSLQEEIEMEIVLPVKYRNQPPGIILADDNPSSVTFRVRDKGLVLLSYSWLNKFAPIEVNLKGLQEEDRGEITVERKIVESSLAKQLISSSILTGFEPQTIVVRYGELQSKELPVVADISVSPEPGFQLSDTITVSPARIRIYAAGSILDSLHVLKTEPAELKKVTETRELSLSLQKIPGIRMEEDRVKVTVHVEEFTEKRLTVPVLCSDLPQNYTLYTFPATIEVICNIPLSRFRELTEADFEIRIPFREFEASRSTGKLSVYLRRQPGWMSRPALNPGIIEFILEKNAVQ